MKRKKDKKYLLTIGTCVALLMFMLFSLTHKGTYSYTECLGVVSPDKNYCCDSTSSYSDGTVHNDKQNARAECENYALNNSYIRYECNISKNTNGMYTWNVVLYNGCSK